MLVNFSFKSWMIRIYGMAVFKKKDVSFKTQRAWLIGTPFNSFAIAIINCVDLFFG